MTIDRDDFEMRAPCPGCGHTRGHIVEKNGQDTVRCLSCDRYCYCAPRTETGRAQRTVTTVHNGIKPKLRTKILERDGYRCVLCKAVDVPLHTGHVVSVAAGLAAGLTASLLNNEENLIAQCEECNAGQGDSPIPLSIAIAILRARLAWKAAQE